MPEAINELQVHTMLRNLKYNYIVRGEPLFQQTNQGWHDWVNVRWVYGDETDIRVVPAQKPFFLALPDGCSGGEVEGQVLEAGVFAVVHSLTKEVTGDNDFSNVNCKLIHWKKKVMEVSPCVKGYNPQPKIYLV